MRKITLLAVLLIIVMSGSVFSAVGNVKWTTLKQGSQKARAEKKPIIVDFFYGPGCPRCERLEKGAYADPRITRKINEEFVPIFIDLTKSLTKEEEELGNKYEYKNDCLMLFLDPEMNIIKDPSEKMMCFVDDIEPDVFIEYLDMIIRTIKK